jgi:hypothetical protein
MILHRLSPHDAKEVEVEHLHYDPVHRFTAPMLSDTSDSGILGVAEHGCRVYRNVLLVAAH